MCGTSYLKKHKAKDLDNFISNPHMVDDRIRFMEKAPTVKYIQFYKMNTMTFMDTIPLTP